MKKKMAFVALAMAFLGMALTSCGMGEASSHLPASSSDQPSVLPSSNPELNRYTITWLNYDSTVLEIDNGVLEGTMPTYDGATPTKVGTAQFSYIFSGWSPSVEPATCNATYFATFVESINNYTVNWSIDGVITSETYHYGDMPSYKWGTPTKSSTAQYSYTFAEWFPALTTVTGETTYTAMFDSTVNSYIVTWIVNGESATETYRYGEYPRFKLGTPQKPRTTQHHYEFTGWSPELSAVTCNATYEAQFAEYVNTYLITWKNYDGSTLEMDYVPYGELPSYDGKTPEKPSTAQYSYIFTGWSPTVSNATANATYVAQFESKLRTYRIIWKNADGSILEIHDNVPYGSMPSFDGETPTMASSTPDNPYVFAGWIPSVAVVTGNATYTAIYTGGEAVTYIYEAENCKCVWDMEGATWSGGATGLGMVGKDVYNTGAAKASAGFYVHYNYIFGNTISWNIESSAEVDDLLFVARFAAEYRDFPTYKDNGSIYQPAIQPDNFIISLNDNPINYDPISLKCSPSLVDECGKFSDFVIGTGLHLNAGNNVIKMIVANTIMMQGTATASSPCIDCIKLTTKSVLTWTDEDPTLPHIAWD